VTWEASSSSSMDESTTPRVGGLGSSWTTSIRRLGTYLRHHQRRHLQHASRTSPSTRFHRKIEQSLVSAFEFQEHKWSSNWGNQITVRTPDGLNWNGTIHYREDSVPHGFWQRYGFSRQRSKMSTSPSIRPESGVVSSGSTSASASTCPSTTRPSNGRLAWSRPT